MKNVPMTRDEAEWLVDLLEKSDPDKVGQWTLYLAANIRDVFGMIGQEESSRKPEKPNAA